MIISNNYNLPTAIFNAVSKTYPPNPKRMSITTLIDSPLIRKLKIEHWEDLEEDASSRLWALLGQGVHAVLGDREAIVETKLEVEIDGMTVVGKTDNYKQGVITDWKVTSVWHHIFSDNKQETAQLNCYAWLWRRHNYPVEKLIIYRILRDWQMSKVGNDYPPIPFVAVEVPLWTFEQQEQYVKDQLEYHQMAKTPECTSDEKWEKPTTYAVMKKGRKSALRVLGSFGTACDWMADKQALEPKGSNNLSIIERKGECVRCKSYCPVRAVCPNNKEKENGLSS